MKIISTGIFVDNQDKALDFYTKVLGFVLKDDIPVGDYRWITVVAPSEKAGTELVLEPNAHPAAKEYQQRIYTDGIPANMFGVENMEKEYEMLCEKGVIFTMKPTKMDGYIMAILDDTCGNLIQIIER